MNGHDHHGPAATHRLVFDSPAMAAFSELEGEVLIGLLTEAASVLAELYERLGVEVRRVLDVGCGPGVGTCCLALRFASASVVAVDGAATMLEHASARAERLGLAERVDTRLVELPAGFGTLGRTDVAWASMALHHIGDEAAALRRIRGLLDPGGLLAVVERADPLRVLPGDADLGRPGIWDRLDAAWAAWFTDMRADLPGATTSADYPAMLAAAGFDLMADEVLRLVLDAPLDARARRFAHGHLLRARAQLGPYAVAADLEALDVLIDETAEEGILRRDDALLCASRHLYLARAVPGASPRDPDGNEVGFGGAPPS
ncbi:MAG: class I SAM-dependent methyltransferase [Acidimicrobiales bacterium]